MTTKDLPNEILEELNIKIKLGRKKKERDNKEREIKELSDLVDELLGRLSTKKSCKLYSPDLKFVGILEELGFSISHETIYEGEEDGYDIHIVSFSTENAG